MISRWASKVYASSGASKRNSKYRFAYQMDEDGVREGYSDEDEDEKGDENGFDVVDSDFIRREMRDWTEET